MLYGAGPLVRSRPPVGLPPEASEPCWSSAGMATGGPPSPFYFSTYTGGAPPGSVYRMSRYMVLS